MSHSLHPDIHTHGLADDCPECSDAAEQPWRYLDERALAALVELAATDDRLARARSEAEAVASANVLTQMERFGRLASVAPVALTYLERWNVGPPPPAVHRIGLDATKAECGYHENYEDANADDDRGIEGLIDYKNALEDFVGSLDGKGPLVLEVKLTGEGPDA